MNGPDCGSSNATKVHHLCCPLLCPVSPSLPGAEGSEGWADLDDAPIPVESKIAQDKVVTEEEVEADTGEAWQTIRGMPEPIQPSRAERERHALTHMPYKNWCPHCVAARRTADAHHRHKGDDQRTMPLLVFDYAFLRTAEEEELVTCLIGRLYPSRITFAVVCDHKGRDPHVISRLAAFIRESGVRTLVYKSD